MPAMSLIMLLISMGRKFPSHLDVLAHDLRQSSAAAAKLDLAVYLALLSEAGKS